MRTRKLPPDLEELRVEIREYAVDFGLDFFEVVFEMVDYDEMNMIASLPLISEVTTRSSSPKCSCRSLMNCPEP